MGVGLDVEGKKEKMEPKTSGRRMHLISLAVVILLLRTDFLSCDVSGGVKAAEESIDIVGSSSRFPEELNTATQQGRIEMLAKKLTSVPVHSPSSTRVVPDAQIETIFAKNEGSHVFNQHEGNVVPGMLGVRPEMAAAPPNVAPTEKYMKKILESNQLNGQSNGNKDNLMLLIDKSEKTEILDAATEVEGNTRAKPSATRTKMENGSMHRLANHLEMIKEIENVIVHHIDGLDDRVEHDQSSNKNQKMQNMLINELHRIKDDLIRLSEGLNETFDDLHDVEKDAKTQEDHLRDMMQEKKEQEQRHSVEEQGLRAVDYETGQLKNMTGLSLAQIVKLKKMEKNSDPAVLHYDFDLLGEIALLFGVSALGGILGTYLQLPPTLGYVLGGAIIGPSGLGYIKKYTEVETISLFGSIFLLFSHGAESSLNIDKSMLPYLLLGVVYVASILLLSAFALLSFQWTDSNAEAFMVGCAICLSSTSPLYHYVRVKKLLKTQFGRAISGILLVQNWLMSFILTLPEFLAATSLASFSAVVIRTLLAYASMVAMFYFLRTTFVPRFLVMLGELQNNHDGNDSSFVLLGVVSVCLMMALFTEIVGLSLESGAFCAGLAFMEAENVGLAMSAIQSLNDLFGSIFFACIGMIISPFFVVKNLGSIGLLIVLICTVKFVVATTIIKTVELSFKKVFAVAISLSQIGEFSLIFMIKAHAMGLVSRRLYLLLVATTSIFVACSSLFHRPIEDSTRCISLPRIRQHQLSPPISPESSPRRRRS